MNARLTLLIGLAFPACGPEPSTGSKTPPEAPASDVDTALPIVEPEPPCQLYRWYADADADGHGDPYAMVEECAQPSGYVDNYTDCDDADADAHPGSIWYADTDGDGFGDPDTALARCQRPLAHVTNADDCDDTDDTRNPDSVWYADADVDGYGNPDITVPSCDTTGAEVPDGTDCDDEEASIHPARVEICDYIDNNCNGLVDDDDAEVDIYTKLMYYRDNDGDNYGTTEELGMFCESSDPGAVVDTDCDDTTDLVHPGRIELPDETDQNCDGQTAYHYVNETPEGIWTTGIDSSILGARTTADLDGDGLPEIILADSTDSAGQVMVLPGTTPRDRSDAGSGLAVWTGDAEGDYLGYHYDLELPGDMDGDGTPELIVTSKYAADDAGIMYLLNGIPASGDISTAATWSWTGPGDGQQPSTITPLGDIDADGFDDILVGTPLHSGTYTKEGAVWTVSGASVGVSSEVSDGTRLLATPEDSELIRYTSFGSDLVNAGDMDGDGVAEILVGHSGVPLFEWKGRIYRFAATDFTDSALSTADADRYTGTEASDRMGGAMEAVGDVNGDGYQDILSTSYSRSLSGYGTGTVFLYYGAVTLPANTDIDDAGARIGNDLGDVTYSGDDLWASTVRGLGDLNGDGADDFLIGSSGADMQANYSNNGTASIFLGGALSGDYGTLGSADVRFWGSSAYGVAMALTPGDLDGDGLDDFFIGDWLDGSTDGLALHFYPGAQFQ